ncbi:MAG: hypothetical protein JEZ12_28215 [Desulfobacterium sp.]|nr:hypothetical protein [Desulfobacterium sp.]
MTQAWWLGIDPGKDGAMCLKSGDSIIVSDYESLYLTSKRLREWESEYQIAGAFIEYVHNMPKDGGSSAFRFGTNYGQWLGFLAMLDIDFKKIPTKMWHKGLFKGIKGRTTKKKSLALARQMFPDSQYFLREGDHDRAEAMLIAHQCERFFHYPGRRGK